MYLSIYHDEFLLPGGTLPSCFYLSCNSHGSAHKWCSAILWDLPCILQHLAWFYFFGGSFFFYLLCLQVWHINLENVWKQNFLVFYSNHSNYLKNSHFTYHAKSTTYTQVECINVFVFRRSKIWQKEPMKREWRAREQSGFIQRQKINNQQTVAVSSWGCRHNAGGTKPVLCGWLFGQSRHNTVIKSCFWFHCCLKAAGERNTPTHSNIFHWSASVTGKCGVWFLLWNLRIIIRNTSFSSSVCTLMHTPHRNDWQFN